MKKTIKILSVLIFILISSIALGQQNNKDLKKTINELVQKSDNQAKEIEELKKTNITTHSIESKAKRINENIALAKEREDSFFTYISWFFTIIGSAILFFLGGSYYEFKNNSKKIKEEAKKELNNISEKAKEELKITAKESIDVYTQKFQKITNEKEETIKKMVENKGWEFELMSKSNIITVNPNKKDDSKNLQHVLKWFNIKGGNINNRIELPFNKPNEIVQKIKQFVEDTDKYNVVLLENSDGNWKINAKDPSCTSNIEDAKKIAANLPENTMLVYFGPREAGNFPNSTNDYLAHLSPKAKEIISKYTKGANFNITDENDKAEFNKIKKELGVKVNKIIDCISFVNTPSKLYPNLIDALKYLDILNQPNA